MDFCDSQLKAHAAELATGSQCIYFLWPESNAMGSKGVTGKPADFRWNRDYSAHLETRPIVSQMLGT